MATSQLPILRRETTEPKAFNDAVWRRVFNHRRESSRIPRAVVNASSVEHIKAAVQLANQEKCRVSVRSGGHSWAVWSVRDDAILVDLGDFKFIEYDEKSKIVSCSPSTTSAELMEFLNARGRFFSTGHCGDVAMGGFLLGGGQGWNAKNWGHSIEQMVAIDVVTEDGNEIHCSAVENEELFWLARGGGPGFPGIITSFSLQTRPFTAVYRTLLAWPVTEIPTIMNWITKVSDDFDTDTELAGFVIYPPGSPAPVIAALFISLKGSVEEAKQALQSLKADQPAGALIEEVAVPTTFKAEYAFQTATLPDNYRYCVDSVWLSNDADVGALLAEPGRTIPGKTTTILYQPITSSQRPVKGDPAFSLQTKHYVSLYCGWPNAEDDEEHIQWVDKTINSFKPHSVGSLVSDFDFQRRETKHWSEEKGTKVMALRRKYDPAGRFAGFLNAGDKSGPDGLRTNF
ncbi:FAD binding domain protein [Trichoderma sp. SZMC 28012]